MVNFDCIHLIIKCNFLGAALDVIVEQKAMDSWLCSRISSSCICPQVSPRHFRRQFHPVSTLRHLKPNCQPSFRRRGTRRERLRAGRTIDKRTQHQAEKQHSGFSWHGIWRLANPSNTNTTNRISTVGAEGACQVERRSCR